MSARIASDARPERDVERANRDGDRAIDRLAPWIEGLVLAAAVAFILVAGGEAVRASYHGYLHAALGEAVMRDGLQPENPYHAGAPLRYYTLYPWLGVAIGRIGCGPLWGFAILNIVAALLLAPALDALARELGLSFAARRAAFVAAVLGFNGLGWIGLLVHGTADFGRPPVYALMPMTFARESFGWDARLQAFLPKFLNVSSYAIALPFALWAMKEVLHDEQRAMRARRAVVPLALSIALNPIVGAFAGGVVAISALPTLASGTVRERAPWVLAGIAAIVLALPFLLPGLHPAPHGPSLTGNPALGGNPASNLVGPVLVLIVPAILGIARFEKRVRWRFLVALAIAAALVVVGEMPQGNEYKMERLLALLLALPAGATFARMHASGGARRMLAWLLAIVCVPTTVCVPWAYLAYGSQAASLPLVSERGRLSVRADGDGVSLAREILDAEAAADPRAVLLTPLDLPGARLSERLVQGNALAPALHHALFVDRPQIHNEHLPDLEDRLELAGRAEIGRNVDPLAEPGAVSPATALTRIRMLLPTRPFLVVCTDVERGLGATLPAIGASLLARGGGYALWSLPAAGSVFR
jgi:hypothetical protein